MRAYRLLAKNNTFITPTLVTEHSLTFIDDLNAKARFPEAVCLRRRSWQVVETGERHADEIPDAGSTLR